MHEKTVRDLEKIVGKENVSTGAADKISYSRDMWPRNLILLRCGVHRPYSADAVVWPTYPAQVASIVRYCAASGVRLIPYGAGSGVCGGTIPREGGVIVDMKKMGQVRPVDTQHHTVDVQAGAIGQVFEDDLNRQGYTAGHFPASIYCSTVGGWIAARGAGQFSSLYGKIEDIVLRLRVVTMDGEISDVGGFPSKAEGPNWLQVFLGSEGTLGIVVDARLKVHRLPERRSMRAVKFPTLRSGVECMREVVQKGLRPALLRLYDPLDTFVFHSLSSHGGGLPLPEAVRRARKAVVDMGTARMLRHPRLVRQVMKRAGEQLSAGVLLMAGFEGDALVVDSELNIFLSTVKQFKGADLGEEAGARWLDRRYGVSYKQSHVFSSDCFSDTMEISATWDRILRIYAGVLDAVSRDAVAMAHFSHAYPHGCSIYFTFAGSGDSDEESLARYDATWKRAMKAVQQSGGILSHHHGVGMLKASAMKDEMGNAYEVLAELKGALDPGNLLNPGKLVS